MNLIFTEKDKRLRFLPPKSLAPPLDEGKTAADGHYGLAKLARTWPEFGRPRVTWARPWLIRSYGAAYDMAELRLRRGLSRR